MEYSDKFELDFISRTLILVENYTGSLDATFQVNCLLGLLLVPKEKFIERVPADPVEQFFKWGISSASIMKYGKKTKKNKYPETLRGVVWNLRNSVAHFNIEPVQENNTVRAFRFTDKNGFHAVMPLREIKMLVKNLAGHLAQDAAS